jgi:DNA-binding GntR family transcriptional regulator
MTTVEANDPRTPSVQIADHLRTQIDSGEIGPGTKLPSGRSLASQYGVALMTAQAALQRLRDEGRVYSTSRGYFVGTADESPSLAERLQEMESEVRELRARVENLESGE